MTQTAVQMAVAAAEEEPWEPEVQFDLLGLGPTHDSEAIAKKEAAAGAKKLGRPPGALNKATREWAEYLGARYTHPLETLAAIQATPVDQLAARLGCTKLEALQEKRIAAAMLLPYMAKKMPIAVNVNGKILHLNILDPGDALPDDSDVIELMPEQPAPAPAAAEGERTE